MSQEKKKELAPAIKAVLKKYKVKGSLAVDNYSTLVLNIKSSPLDMIGEYSPKRDYYTPEEKAKVTNIQVNTYWYKEKYTGKTLEFLSEVIPLMNIGNHDRSDIMTDYFDVGWYVDVNIGKWDKPYEVI